MIQGIQPLPDFSNDYPIPLSVVNTDVAPSPSDLGILCAVFTAGNSMPAVGMYPHNSLSFYYIKSNAKTLVNGGNTVASVKIQFQMFYRTKGY